MSQRTNNQTKDTGGLNWRKSSRCGEASHCVEVALTQDGALVRDTKQADSPVLTFDKAEWAAFTAGIKNGEFDLQATK